MGSIAEGIGSVVSGIGGLFGASQGDDTPDAQVDPRVAVFLPFLQEAAERYQSMYNDYYWPIEENLAQYYQEDSAAQRPYSERMRDYQLARGDELVALAQDTNPLLDENKKSLIRRLTEGEDVLADRYRGQVSNDVADAYAQQRSQLQDTMNRAGINPNSGAFASNFSNMAQNEALSQAAGRTSASRMAEDTSLQRMGQALSLYTNPTMQYNLGNAPTAGLSFSDMLGYGGATNWSGEFQSQNDQTFGGLGDIASGAQNVWNNVSSWFD